MAESELPKTPTPASRTLRRHDGSGNSSAQLTPPPSDRKARTSFVSRYQRDPVSPTRISLPPLMARPPPQKAGSFGAAMPSPEQVQGMPAEQLRDLTNDLIPSLGEARMELAHMRLQYQLLSIETREAAERAEVEHDMTRKEVEVLQAGSPILHSRAAISPDPRSALAQVQQQLQTVMQRNHELHADNAGLERRLKDAKRVIKYLDGRNLELDDTNKLLRDRIRENREHLNTMRSTGLLRSAPSSPKQGGHQHAPAGSHTINHYATPARPRRPEFSHTPATPTSRMPFTPRCARPHDTALDTLLFASAVVDTQHERASVPSTPSPTRTMRQPPNHTRGTLSLSSLPVTPKTSRTQYEDYQTPGRPAPRGFESRRHSASTISDSSSQETPVVRGDRNVPEEATTEDELPLSQASQAASDLLRRHPAPASQERPSSGLGLIQTKLTGKVVKGNKRSASGVFESPKKQKTGLQSKQDVGLGIGMGNGAWPGRS